MTLSKASTDNVESIIVISITTETRYKFCIDFSLSSQLASDCHTGHLLEKSGLFSCQSFLSGFLARKHVETYQAIGHVEISVNFHMADFFKMAECKYCFCYYIAI